MAGRISHTWRATELWSELESRDQEPAPKLKLLLEDVLPQIEKVLNKADTMPGNFTLHEGDHSERVAAWMAELAGEDLLRQMSSDEVALLLCSAYLHDIGMTPRLGKVRDAYELLVSGDPAKMTEDEVEELQAWLDEEWNGITPPIGSERPTRKELRLVNQIISGYVRGRHNEWSEEWIRAFFDHKEVPYPRWVDHLVRICKSHHQGFDELASDDFRPLLVDSPAQVLHLRYCACLLRVADILDFDPERTPRILFEHRDVEEISAIFWQKDRGISFKREGNRLELSAEPSDALIHHAIVQTVEAVNRELHLCRQLDDETNFQHRPGSKQALPHRWTLDAAVTAIVTPADKAYTYIDGTFQPDAQRLLELLAGVELYQTPLAALRELLQNAFDAVREQMARQRLRARNPASSKTHVRVAADHEVTLTVTRTESGLLLTCTDTGVGMSREVITDRFLVGGSTPGHDLRRLERECEASGFSLERTAHFGIGVLSYFLMADRLVIHTCRSREGGNHDGMGWTFSSLGLTDFGELKADANSPQGTTVEFEIDIDKWGEDREDLVKGIEAYVRNKLRRLPCAFSFSAPGFDVPDFACNGWPSREAEIREYFAEELSDEALDALVFESHSGELPDGFGAYRIHLCHFETGGGPSLAYMKLIPADRDRFEIGTKEKSEGVQLGSVLRHSWNGMSIDTADELDLPPNNAVIEIDWTSNEAGRLMVHRDYFNPSETAADAVKLVNERAEELLREFATEHIDAPMALFNFLQLDAGSAKFTAPPSPCWQHDEGDWGERWYFGPLNPPIVDRHPMLDAIAFSWRGKPVTIPAVLEIRPFHGGRGHWSWFGHSQPQFIGAVETEEGIEPIGVWEKIESSDASRYTPRKTAARFPPEWKALVGAAILWPWRETTWNRNHPLLQAVDGDAWRWAQAVPSDPRHHLDELFDAGQDPEGRVAAWMLMCLQRSEKVWKELSTGSPEILSKAWSLVEGLEELGKILFYGQRLGERTVKVVTAGSWQEYEGEEADRVFAHELRVPRRDWLLIPKPS